MIPEPGNLPGLMLFGTSVERGAEAGLQVLSWYLRAPVLSTAGAFRILGL